MKLGGGHVGEHMVEVGGNGKWMGSYLIGYMYDILKNKENL